MFRFLHVSVLLGIALVFSNAALLRAQNLLVNPDFEHDVIGWDSGGLAGVEWNSRDAGDSSDSGSAKVFLVDERPSIGSGISQKIPVTPGDTFDMGAKVLFGSDQDSTVAAEVFVFWYETTSGCSGQYLESRGYSEFVAVQPEETWQSLSLQDAVAPDGATCGQFAFNINNSATEPPSEGFFDDTFVSKVGGTVDLCQSPYEYIVPAGAHAAGAQGSSYETDMTLLNLGGENAAVEVFLLERDQDNTEPRSVRLSVAFPRSTAVLDDIIFEQFGEDDLAAAFLICSSQPLLGMSRTFNIETSATEQTFGQGIPAYAESSALAAGDVGQLTFLYEGARFRTNIGMVNTSQSPIIVDIALYDAEGTELGVVSEEIPPLGYLQRSRIFRSVTSSNVEGGSAQVEISGGRALVYASILDNASNDPTFMLAIRGEK